MANDQDNALYAIRRHGDFFVAAFDLDNTGERESSFNEDMLADMIHELEKSDDLGTRSFVGTFKQALSELSEFNRALDPAHINPQAFIVEEQDGAPVARFDWDGDGKYGTYFTLQTLGEIVAYTDEKETHADNLSVTEVGINAVYKEALGAVQASSAALAQGDGVNNTNDISPVSVSPLPQK